MQGREIHAASIVPAGFVAALLADLIARKVEMRLQIGQPALGECRADAERAEGACRVILDVRGATRRGDCCCDEPEAGCCCDDC